MNGSVQSKHDNSFILNQLKIKSEMPVFDLEGFFRSSLLYPCAIINL